MRRGPALAAIVALLVAAACTPEPERRPGGSSPTTIPGGTVVEEQPPLAWIGGSLEEIGPDTLAVREGEGPRVVLRRLSAGTTRFYRSVDGTWTQLTEAEVDALEVGEHTCTETLLDGSTLVALRVFLGAECGPS